MTTETARRNRGGADRVMRYLDMHAAAAHLGVAYATIRRYRATGGFPDADVVVGQSPGWLAETIDAWQASRPGRGTGGGRPKGDAS